MKKIRLTQVSKAILITIGAVGLLSVALVAPNAIQMLKPFLGKDKKIRNDSFNRTFRNLKTKGYIKIVDNNVFLTKEGKKLLFNSDLKDYGKSDKWDGKFRVVIFDIPETNRKARAQLRKTLVEIGFLKLQNSVWIYPYDCRRAIDLIKSNFIFGKDLLYLVVDNVEGDQEIRKHFNI